MRAFLVAANVALFALIAAAPLRVLALRGLPGRALAATLVAAACGALLVRARRRRLPMEITALLLLPPAVAWGLGEGFGLFLRVPVWDVIAHAVAGLGIGAIAAPLCRSQLRPSSARAIRALLLATALAALAGVLWEGAEWTVDALLGSETLGSAGDTVGDLIADVAGAGAGGVAALLVGRRLPARHRLRLALALQDLARAR